VITYPSGSSEQHTADKERKSAAAQEEEGHSEKN